MPGISGNRSVPALPASRSGYLHRKIALPQNHAAHQCRTTRRYPKHD